MPLKLPDEKLILTLQNSFAGINLSPSKELLFSLSNSGVVHIMQNIMGGGVDSCWGKKYYDGG